MKEFKLGQKVKIPKTKGAGWGDVSQSIAVKGALRKNQPFLFYNGQTKHEVHLLSENWDPKYPTGDYFSLDDIEAYEEHKFKVGDEVKISKQSSYYWFDEYSNPKDVRGAIISIGNYGHRINVKWSNGSSNCYNEVDLEFYEEKKKAFKVGDKVKIPKTKQGAPNVCYHAKSQVAKDRGFLYIVDIRHSGVLVLNSKCNTYDGNYYNASDLELYEEEYVAQLGDLVEILDTPHVRSWWKGDEAIGKRFIIDLPVKRFNQDLTSALNLANTYGINFKKGDLKLIKRQETKIEEKEMKNLFSKEFIVLNCTGAQRAVIKEYCDKKGIKYYSKSFESTFDPFYPNIKFDGYELTGTRADLSGIEISFADLIKGLEEYKPQPKFKVGDFVTVLRAWGSQREGDVFKILNISYGNKKTWIHISENANSDDTAFRLSTQKEIVKWKEENEIKLPKIADYDGSIKDGRIHYGCTSIAISTFNDLYKAQVSSINFSGAEVKIDDISKIYKYLEAKKLI